VSVTGEKKTVLYRRGKRTRSSPRGKRGKVPFRRKDPFQRRKVGVQSSRDVTGEVTILLKGLKRARDRKQPCSTRKNGGVVFSESGKGKCAVKMVLGARPESEKNTTDYMKEEEKDSAQRLYIKKASPQC